MNFQGNIMRKTNKDSIIVCLRDDEHDYMEMLKSDICKYKGKEVTILQIMPARNEKTYIVEIVEKGKEESCSNTYPKHSKQVE